MSKLKKGLGKIVNFVPNVVTKLTKNDQARSMTETNDGEQQDVLWTDLIEPEKKKQEDRKGSRIESFLGYSREKDVKASSPDARKMTVTQ